MTRCTRDDVNLIKLKSSVYNQTGENYHQQLNIHRSMCAHVRRIFSAKSVVDTRNPRYSRMMQRRCRPLSCRRKLLEPGLNNVIIDRLAYDTEHHPSQILKAQCRSKSNSKERSCSRDKQRAANSTTGCPCAHQSVPRDRPSTAKSTPKHQKRCEIDLSSCMGQTRRRDFVDIDEPQMYDQKRASSPCPSTRSRRCKFEAKRQQQRQQPCSSADYDRRLSHNDDYDEDEDGENVGYADEGNCCNDGKEASRSRPASNSQRRRQGSASKKSPRSCREEALMRKAAERGDDEARYAKFVFDITQEIVQNGLYNDEQLRQVFDEHVEKNSACLSRRRMLYEIYQLKISLNMESDSCEDDDDMIFAENFVEHRVPKPPTPPKVLNDNKVMEKLESFRLMQDCSDRNGLSSPCCKNVVFVDANPEFLVTERDVLCTLMDNDVHPQQIQRIYKNLFQRSKDMTLCEAVQVGKEVAYTHRLKQVDKSSSMTSLCPKSPGILRRKSPEISPPDLSHQRLDCIKTKQKEALEKCAKWNISEGCGCKDQPCKHAKEFEPEKRTKSTLSPKKYCNCERSCEKEIGQSTQKSIEKRDKSVGKISPDRKPKTPSKPMKPITFDRPSTSQPKRIEKQQETRAKSASRSKTATIATPPRSIKKHPPAPKTRQKPEPQLSPTTDKKEALPSARSEYSSEEEVKSTRQSTPASVKQRKIRRSVTPIDSDVSDTRSIEEDIEVEKQQRKSSSSSVASSKPRTPKKINRKSSKSSKGFISMAKRRQSTFSIIPLPLFQAGSPQKKIFHSGQAGLDGDELTIVSSVQPSRMRTPEFSPEQGSGSGHTDVITVESSMGKQKKTRRKSTTLDKSSGSRRSIHGPTRMGTPVDAQEIREALHELQRDSGAEDDDDVRDQLSLVPEESEAEAEASTMSMGRSHPPDRSTGQDTSSSDDDLAEQAGKHQQHRYPTVRDYMERFAAGEDASPDSWRQPSAASSDSSSSFDDELPTGERPTNGPAALLVNNSNDGSRRPLPTRKKRASSGFGGYQVMDTWNDNLSEMPHELNNPPDEQESSNNRSKQQRDDQQRRG
ncbi:hypothetical protein QAD02_004795 [Eretmocerus hayati]|uniref:Uncharacterized protein n=1 Tax=Eretmocerus hayati TaxID=131215 RepID=A0ACC2NRR4_9HYME|nr:hypothetical protein QAD02_004795 [Eretmocerus hayati]